jgi:hypothetical protein
MRQRKGDGTLEAEEGPRANDLEERGLWLLIAFDLRRVGGLTRGGYTFGFLNTTDAAGQAGFGKYIAAWRRDHGWRIEALLQIPSLSDPTNPPSDAILAGYHGFAMPCDDGALSRQVKAADRAFAALSVSMTDTTGYGPSFVAYADLNATVFGQRNLYYGIDWVDAIYSQTSPGERLDWAPVAGEASESGDLGWTVGNAAYHFQDSTGVFDEYLKYLTVWARQSDGSWKWLLDAGNDRPAPAPR